MVVHPHVGHHTSCMVFIVTYLTLRHMLRYTNGQQLPRCCNFMTLGIQVHLLISLHEYVELCYKAYAYVTQSSTTLTRLYTNDTCH